MCELCNLSSADAELRTRTRDAQLAKAVRLEALADDLRSMAYGEIKPHTTDAKITAARATDAIRMLVEDWL